jgi:hypothetical protein
VLGLPDKAPAEKKLAAKVAANKSSGPSRTTINFLLDTLLLVLFLIMGWAAFVVRFVFPAGTEAAGYTLWGAGYDQWAVFEFNLLCVFAFAVLVHVMLHWSWVCGVVASRLSRWLGRSVRIDEGTQTIYGVGLMVVILNIVGLGLALAALSIHSPTH